MSVGQGVGLLSLHPFGRFMKVPADALWMVLIANTSRRSRHQTAVSLGVVMKQTVLIGIFELSTGIRSFENPFLLVLMVPAQ